MLACEEVDINKDNFVDKIKNRLTKTYSVPVHSVGALISISISFILTFLLLHDSSSNPLLNIVGLELLNFGSFALCFLFYKFVFKGLSYGSFPFFVRYKYSPVDFVTSAYLFISLVAIVISNIGLEFTRESIVLTLTPLESFYYVVGVVSTTGSNIYPKSADTEVLSVILSFVTLFLFIFVFQTLPHKKLNRKVVFEFSSRRLGDFYDELAEISNNSKLTNEQKKIVFDYFLKKFNFDQPNGTTKVTMQMKAGCFPLPLH